ncbi:MAG TPA: hypothetical protein VM899_00250 [Rubellimicrobium sp.]|nr:hypothetical protein [Rubellimicrobium sp.]
MGTDTTPPDADPPRADTTVAWSPRPFDGLRKAVANDNTNGAPRPEQVPEPSPGSIIRPVPGAT